VYFYPQTLKPGYGPANHTLLIICIKSDQFTNMKTTSWTRNLQVGEDRENQPGSLYSLKI